VRELTDDRTLSSAERKQAQIDTAAAHTPRAQLVKLADKLYNLRDLKRQTPVGWTSERVQQYFEWSAKVVRGLRGVSAPMEESLDALFQERGVLHLAK